MHNQYDLRIALITDYYLDHIIKLTTRAVELIHNFLWLEIFVKLSQFLNMPMQQQTQWYAETVIESNWAT